jgi:hypothetical protein
VEPETPAVFTTTTTSYNGQQTQIIEQNKDATPFLTKNNYVYIMSIKSARRNTSLASFGRDVPLYLANNP